MQGGEYHASPSVGLQAPLVVLVLVSLTDDSGAEEEEEVGGVLSTGLACTTAGAGGVEDTPWDVRTVEGASGTVGADVAEAGGRSCNFPAWPAQE